SVSSGGAALLQIIVHHLAEAEGEVAEDVRCRDHLEHRQFRDGRECVWVERERRGTGPGTLDVDVLEIELDELADARAAVDVRDDLEEVVGLRQRGPYRV